MMRVRGEGEKLKIAPKLWASQDFGDFVSPPLGKRVWGI